MTIYDYMCDVLHIEACIDCPNFKNWECIGGYSQCDYQCLQSLNVTAEDIENWEHPNIRIWRKMQKDIEETRKKLEERQRNKKY